MPEVEKTRSLQEQQALDYRNRAEELRTVGEGTKSPGARRILLDLADDADKMASAIEQRIKGASPPPAVLP